MRLPSEIKGRKVRDIVNKWTQELQEHSRTFVRCARELQQTDTQILRARYSLVELERDLEATVRMHGTLDKAIGAVEANQAEVHRALESIEEEAERRFQEESSRLDAAGSQRDRLYQRAVGVMEQLYRMDSYLREAAQNINAAVDAAAEGADSGVLPYLSQVLGSQAESIRSIEERTRELERQLEAMQASQRA